MLQMYQGRNFRNSIMIGFPLIERDEIPVLKCLTNKEQQQ